MSNDVNGSPTSGAPHINPEVRADLKKLSPEMRAQVLAVADAKPRNVFAELDGKRNVKSDR